MHRPTFRPAKGGDRGQQSGGTVHVATGTFSSRDLPAQTSLKRRHDLGDVAAADAGSSAVDAGDPVAYSAHLMARQREELEERERVAWESRHGGKRSYVPVVKRPRLEGAAAEAAAMLAEMDKGSSSSDESGEERSVSEAEWEEELLRQHEHDHDPTVRKEHEHDKDYPESYGDYLPLDERGAAGSKAAAYPDGWSESSSEEESSEDEEDEDEEAEQLALLRELEKIKQEKEQSAQRLREDLKRQQDLDEEEAALRSNPLLDLGGGSGAGSEGRTARRARADDELDHDDEFDEDKEGDTFAVRPKWYEGTVFRNQARAQPKATGQQFINDPTRNAFHKRFLNTFIR